GFVSRVSIWTYVRVVTDSQNGALDCTSYSKTSNSTGEFYEPILRSQDFFVIHR
ncbi:hypothetical protein HAX54_008204, partial [Datura stramonium]|nr:hypothetical protein [Datura stramonium]